MSKRRRADVRAARRAAALLKSHAAVCNGNLVPWHCDCTFGCEMCHVTHECERCGRLLSEHVARP